MSGSGAPLLLDYTSFFGRDPPAAFTEGTAWTRDRRRLPEAGIVLFHFPDLNLRHLRAARKYPGQLWVGWTMESTIHYPRARDPALLALFDIVALCDRRSDLWLTYVPTLAELKSAMAAPLPDKTEAAPLVMFQSSSFDRSGRNAYAAKLTEHIPIDSFGKFLNNRPLGSPDAGSLTKRGVISRYRFCIAFENAIEFDYVTEKLYDPLLAGTVPIYRGAPNVEDFAPGADSFIDADRFRSPKDLAAYLLHLSRNPAEYERHFAWRHRPLPSTLEAYAAASGISAFSRIADWVERAYPPRTVSRTGAFRPFRLVDALAVRRLERRREMLHAKALRKKEPMP
jgi:hypothetical protein